MDSKKKQIRAISKPENEIGMLRHTLFKAGYNRIKQAISEGWYLEAITLIESLLSDRLESRLSYLRNEDVVFQNLGSLIGALRKEESDENILALVSDDVDAWRKKRNVAAHEMMKIAVGEMMDWEERLAELKPVAIDGLKVLRSLDRQVMRLRRTPQKIV